MGKYQDLEDKLKKSIDSLKSELSLIRAGRANPVILDRVMVEYYGTPTPIKSLASVSIPEARIIQIQPFDKGALRDIEKAILVANIGINPTNDGKAIRLIFPELTQDRRKELAKDVKKKGEAAKVAVRAIRKEEMNLYKNMKKNNEITEDDLKNAESDIQKIIDKAIETVEKVISEKEKDIMEV